MQTVQTAVNRGDNPKTHIYIDNGTTPSKYQCGTKTSGFWLGDEYRSTVKKLPAGTEVTCSRCLEQLDRWGDTWKAQGMM